MTNGVFIQDGTITAVVHGFGGTPPAGQTFQALDSLVDLMPGNAPPSLMGLAVGATDIAMARVTEDLVAALVTKGVLAIADLPGAAIAHINARRVIRGLAPLQ